MRSSTLIWEASARLAMDYIFFSWESIFFTNTSSNYPPINLNNDANVNTPKTPSFCIV